MTWYGQTEVVNVVRSLQPRAPGALRTLGPFHPNPLHVAAIKFARTSYGMVRLKKQDWECSLKEHARMLRTHRSRCLSFFQCSAASTSLVAWSLIQTLVERHAMTLA